MDAWKIIEGDCRAVLPTLDADSVDAVVTDPPYGLSFMSKAWDHTVPGKPFWEAVLRVAKPGAYMLAFGGTRTYHRLACAIEDAGWQIRDCIMWVYGSGFPKGEGCLKPAWEPIILARKPGPKVLPLGIDACRVPSPDAKLDAVQRYSDGHSREQYRMHQAGHEQPTYNPSGRWPANLIHDGSDEVLSLFPTLGKSNGTACGKRQAGGKTATYGEFNGTGRYGEPTGYGDSGSASRFFYCAKASKADREDGNNHPSVKPNALMRYLCRLVTPPGGTVLDPFAGSGSTGKTAVAEGFGFLGIELDPSYCEIARARIAREADGYATPRIPDLPGQRSLFDSEESP